MTPPVQPESELQKIEAIPAEILAWLKHIAQSIGIIHAATPLPPAPPTIVTQTFGGAEPAGTVAPIAAEVNGQPILDGMDQTSFTALVVATGDVATELGNANNTAGLMATTQAWWDALGPYEREQYLAQSTGDMKAHFMSLATGGPAILAITPEQQSAANMAAGAKA
jgi:hypothetical protein